METIKKYSPRRTAAQWGAIVEAQRGSGLSAPLFCKENNISYASFISWKKKLAASKPVSISNKAQPAFIEITPNPQAPEPVKQGASSVQPLNIELDLGAGIQLRICRAG